MTGAALLLWLIGLWLGAVCFVCARLTIARYWYRLGQNHRWFAENEGCPYCAYGDDCDAEHALLIGSRR